MSDGVADLTRRDVEGEKGRDTGRPNTSKVGSERAMR